LEDEDWLEPMRQKIQYNAGTTEYTELQRLLSGVHSVMRVKLALAGEGEGCTPTPFITFSITSKVAVYAPAEWADTLTPVSSLVKICTLWLAQLTAQYYSFIPVLFYTCQNKDN
jgi:hypothetical protein